MSFSYLRGSYCSVHRALDLTRKVVFKKNYEHAKRLVFIIAAVDKDRDGYHAALAADHLHEKGADIIALFIGGKNKRFSTMTKKPFKLYLQIQNYEDLTRVSKLIQHKG